jgi:hypothetical protein
MPSPPGHCPLEILTLQGCRHRSISLPSLRIPVGVYQPAYSCWMARKAGSTRITVSNIVVSVSVFSIPLERLGSLATQSHGII